MVAGQTGFLSVRTYARACLGPWGLPGGPDPTPSRDGPSLPPATLTLLLFLVGTAERGPTSPGEGGAQAQDT